MAVGKEPRNLPGIKALFALRFLFQAKPGDYSCSSEGWMWPQTWERSASGFPGG